MANFLTPNNIFGQHTRFIGAMIRKTIKMNEKQNLLIRRRVEPLKESVYGIRKRRCHTTKIAF